MTWTGTSSNVDALKTFLWSSRSLFVDSSSFVFNSSHCVRVCMYVCVRARMIECVWCVCLCVRVRVWVVGK